MSTFAHLSETTCNASTKLFPSLHVGGFIPLTTLDYPDHLACVIFCQGCAWRCRYCHNSELIPARGLDELSWNSLLEFLERRRGLLEAVVFSGGEPTLQRGLLQAIEQVKAMGYLVGLHSAGINPRLFKQVVNKVDWVGFDVKALPEDHHKITHVSNSGQANWQSLKYLLESGTAYEVRTTVHWHLITAEQLKCLAERLRSEGVERFVVQLARSQKVLDDKLPIAYMQSDSTKLWHYFDHLFSPFILRDNINSES